MLPMGRGLPLGRTLQGARMLLSAHTIFSGTKNRLFISCLFILASVAPGTSWPYDYRYQYNHCPGPEWNVMCRGCCEYDVIRCKCPLQGTPVGYAVPCCRNAINECDPCIIHPGCSIFENCRRCNNGTWGPRDDFFISGQYCSECRPGWTGGDCKKCGGVIRKKQGHIVLESYPNNARCEWTIQVERPFAVELRFMMLSLESHHSCDYDYVEVRDGDSVNSRVIGRFCGNSRPPPFHSSGSSLHVLFVSDGYKNFDGFFATFQEISACSSSPCLHDGTCILDSSRTYRCACLGGYTGKNCEHVVGCLRPPVPKHGSTEGVFYHSGARITFRCDPGFQLRGPRSAVCLSDGTWSSPAPECAPVERVCVLPPKPAHGDHFLVYGPNDVLIALQYLCHQPYELIGGSQRTCLPNNTWSGIPPVCTKVNNTLTKGGKETDKPTEGTPPDTPGNRETGQTGEEGRENAGGENGGAGGEETTSGGENVTAVRRGDTFTGAVPGYTESEDGRGGEHDERRSESGGAGEEKAEGKEPEDNLNTVERHTSGETRGSPDATGTSATKDKGQTEEQLKANGKGDPDEVGPNDTKLRGAGGGAAENAVEVLNAGVGENSSARVETGEGQRSNNSIGSPGGRKTAIGRANVTQYTMYRAGEEGGGTTRGLARQQEKTEKTPDEERRSELEKAKEREKEANLSFRESGCPPLPRLHHGYHHVVPGVEPETVDFFCNHSYALSGDGRRRCQPDGAWSGRQPACVRACREPKVSELVRQRVLPPQVPSRKTPVDKLYSSGMSRTLRSDSPTNGPPPPSSLPRGFHQLYTQIEYECASQYYQHFGSSRRTCLKTGKWSGRHVSCSPVCGKHPTFDPQRPADSHWPWLAAIYRRSNNRAEKKVTGGDGQAGSLKAGGGAGPGPRDEASDWQLVCSGALVNQRSVVVAAHCVTERGKVYPLGADKLKVVVGKRFREDRREDKGPQHLRVESVVIHQNYDPHILDSDVAVIKLLDKAKIGEKVAPLCLSDSQEDPEATSGQGLVTGWSPIPDSALGPEEKARVGLVHLAHVVPCEQQYARNGVPVSVTDNMLCASQKPDYGSNICPSDTGGILVLPPAAEGSPGSRHRPSPKGDDRGRWRLLGLVSFGYDQGECDPDLYTVYTHVATFKNWVESSMS